MYLNRKRIIFFYFLILLILIIVFLRLTYLKVISSDEYYLKALDLWTREAPIEGQRGIIYDRNGKIIVGNKLAPTVVVIPNQIEDKEEVSKSLSNLLKVSKDEILKHLNKNVSVEIIKPSGRKIDNETAKKILELGLKGVYIVGDTVRDYPYGTYLAPVIGFVGSDGQGLSGLEYQYDGLLKGSSGAINMFVDAHGNLIDEYGMTLNNATRGFDLYLTIDLDIQLAIESIIDNVMTMYNPDEVIAIVANPKNMEILAMASRPTFDPSNYQAYSPELYNRNLPIFRTYEPGSVQKIVTYAVGLEEKVFKLDESFHDPGYRIVDGVRIKDWKAGGHGTETFLEVLQNSCNPGFMEIGLRIGKEKLMVYLKKFGFGSKTGIDLMGETTGILFDVNKMHDIETATTAFGQGISVSAIQLVRASCAAVNGGKLYQPSILKGLGISGTNEIIYQNNNETYSQVISEETSKIVASSLERVVSLGTGRSAYVEGYRIGGKTGTAVNY